MPDEMKSLARALMALEVLAASPNGLVGTELAQQLHVDKSSASRLMQTLVRHGFAERDMDTRRFRLGPRIVSLSRIVLAQLSVRDQAKAFLRRLAEETGETAHLAIPAQEYALHLDQIESSATLKVSTPVGTLVPLHCTSLGKALLAFGAAPIPQKLTSYTPRTITDPAILRIHLEQSCQQGYAVDDEEYEVGVRCIASPVFDYRGKVVAAIGVSGPAVRVSLERTPKLGAFVVQVAGELSEQMRFKGPESQNDCAH